MGLLPILGAGAGALLGALLWGIISWLTGYEVGYVAWAIGLAVGFGAAVLGGRGAASGAACAALALLSIFAGKLLAVQLSLSSPVGAIREALEEILTLEVYNERMQAAEEFARVTSEAEYPAFMVRRKFTEANSPAAVTPEDLSRFKEVTVPMLRRNYQEKPGYEQWRQELLDSIVETPLQEFSLVEAVTEGLNAIDILFALLGLYTAFQVGGRPHETQAAEPPQAAPSA